MRRLSLFTALTVLIMGALPVPLSAAAEWKEPPFEVPDSAYIPIPDGQGMRFFFGTWYNPGFRNFVTIIPGAIFYRVDGEADPYEHFPYRVLYEGRNYVFAVRPYWSSISESNWTDFVVFSLQEGLYGPTEPDDADLIRWTCTDDRMMSAKAFYWSVEKLEHIYHSGMCGEGAREPFEEWYFDLPEHWDASRYIQDWWTGSRSSGEEDWPRN